MSRSQNSQDKKMMHSNIMFDRERDTGYSNAMRKNRMKRMEELSHSLDDGLNNLPDEYERSQRGNASGSRRVDTRYEDMDDEDDFGDDDFNDDYYYSNSKQPYDNRPRSYNEKYSTYSYDEYDPNFNRNRYSLNETAMNKNTRYQQSPSSQQKYSSLRKPQDTKAPPQSSSGNGHHGSNKHILFNDEDDVMYMSEMKKSSTSSSSSAKKTSSKKDIKNETITASPTAANKKKQDLSPTTKSEKSSSLQVMKAKLKIHNLSNDDSALQTRSNKLQNAFHRHHSVESKMPSSHHSDRSNMSPTILEEIEFETQDYESETIEIDRDKKGKEKSKGNSSAPSTPTTKKSLKEHLSNHKKLFKVPDIDLNNLKFSRLFSSNKIAALKGKKEDSVTKSAEALNEPPSSSKSSPKSSPTTKSPPTSSLASATKTPPLSPKKIVKSESKSDKLAQERANAEAAAIEEAKYEKNNNIKIDNDEEFDEGCEEEESISDDEFQVIYNHTPINCDDVESIKTFFTSH